MKILQLTKKFPYPLKDGEAIAITYLAKALQQLGCEMTLLSMNTTKHFFDINTLPASFGHYQSIYLVELDNRLKIKDAFLNLFSNQSYHIARFVSKEFEQKLIALLQNNDYDIIQLETLYLAPYVSTIRQYSKAKIVMRSHNVEHEIWKRITENTRIGAKKMYLNLLSKRLENFEIKSLNSYDMMVAITQKDLDFFAKCGCTIATQVAPIGLETKEYTPSQLTKQKLSFCFIGSLDWLPNVEGVEWILQEVWPQVLAQVPEATFHIAGRNTPLELKNGHWENVYIHGEVNSAADFINSHQVMLVPLFSGSGMRVKILEGMALGRVVLSTSLGLEGIAAKAGKEVLIADTAAEFVAEMVKCVQQKKEIEEIGGRATAFIKTNFDNVNIAKNLVDFYQKNTKIKGVC